MNAPGGEETIFAEALRLPVEQRAAYLAQATRGQAELRQRVEALLESYKSGGFLEQAASPWPTARPHSLPLTVRPGDTIGRYKLLQQIGEGGCGVVYMAEQAEPVHRRVALKIIKHGMDTASVIARFEAERQALALMDHPNIAKVLDGGATDAGRPYFVMELVRGVKITEYCDEQKLPTRGRLDLFILVCQAIQHAHQKGIIHRDIKPSNILVTVNDGVPVPKVIDFGIAKATGGHQLTDKTIFTAFEQFIGTPAYMSPEQVLMTSLDIDTRSDIYALGVLLYELLTGKTPFDAKELLAIGLDEMRRTIREQEPPRPSARLSTLPGQELSTTAQRRGLEAPRLVSELRGDLDWIVMKALEKDRARRYETANGLASDIRRHLNTEPVVACPPSRLYRLQKLVRRNALAFAAGSAVVISLVLGLTLSTILFFRERTARSRAYEQTAVARAVNDFLMDDLLRQADSRIQAEARFTPNPHLTVREALERAAGRIGDRFKDRPLQEAAVQMSIGEAFVGLGESERAIPHVQRALELRRARLPPNHPATLNSMGVLMWAYRVAGKLDQALPLGEETLRLRKLRLGPDDPDTLTSMNNLASAYQEAGKLDQALLLREETLKLRKVRLGPDDPQTLASMANLASALRQKGQLEPALTLYTNTLGLMKAKLEPGHPFLLNVMGNLAAAYLEAGKLELARPLYQEAIKLRKASQGPAHPDTLATSSFLGRCLEGLKDYPEAENVHRELLNHLRAPPSNAPPREVPLLGLTLHHLADALRQRKSLTEARFYAGESVTLYDRHADWPADERRHAFQVLTAVLKDLGDARELMALYRKQAKALRAAAEKGAPATLADLESLLTEWCDAASPLYQQGRWAEAEAMYRDALNHLRPTSSNAPPSEIPALGFILHHLADVLREQDKRSEARAFAEEAMALYHRHADWLAEERRHAFQVLAAVLTDSGDSRELKSLYHQQAEALSAAAAWDDLEWLLTAWSNSASSLHQKGRLDEAEAVYREVLTHLRPASSAAPSGKFPVLGFTLHHLADVLRERQRPGEARPFAEEARTLYQRHTNWLAEERDHSFGVLVAVLKDLGDSEYQAVHLARLGALRAAAEKDDLSALNNLAWLLATSRDAALRDGPSAVGFAERAVAKSERKHPGLLDTLAVAYAAAGEFGKAAEAQREAIRLCPNEQTKNDYAVRLKLYQSNTPYQEP